MNFFKKYWFIISIILFFSIVIIIGFFKGVNETKKGSKSLSNHHKEVDNKQKPNQPLRNKHEIDPPQLKKQITNDKESNQLSSDNRESETPKPKIPITQKKYNKIKSYILSENDNEVLSLNNLSPEDRVKINNIKQELINDLEHSKNYFRLQIDEFQNKCDEYTSQINEIVKQIPTLQKQLQPKEAELETKNKKIDKLKLEKQNEIDQLQSETTEIVKQIMAINLQIKNLEAAQKMYTEMLSRAQNYKKDLEKDYNKSLEQNKQSALSSLNSLYEITSAEG
ncbi:Hypothetical Protein yibP [Candidatus Phytoplasma pruni]|uniref:Uncharacterized protein n=1 Tax=Candidatus Phytoplasma pruni TaxID=479893 RepID=A0A0M1MZW5_9MOLU|nr:hypothetical protein [Candidatus Phytoplasma pruni]KOR75264.1 Hypothetical Protein yibP [Candidatus Phytoplasma pruni]